VSELLEGKTLREVLGSTAKAALPVRKAMEYALQMAHGLVAEHGKESFTATSSRRTFSSPKTGG